MTSRRFVLWFLVLLSTCDKGIVRAQDGSAESTETVHSQTCFIISSDQVKLAITRTGGHMAPVTFFRMSDRPVQPYHISPWQDEPASRMPAPVLVPLRGDFFCMPFGGNQAAFGNEQHPPHGEIADATWKHEATRRSGQMTTLVLSFETKVRPGKVTKEISLADSQNVVYSKHTIEGFGGKVPLGHHATLAMPDEEGSVRLAASDFRFGMTYPGLFSDPKLREYQALQPGAKWTKLSQVPMAWKGQPDADLSRMPGPQGYADLVQIFNESSDKTDGVAWMTATFAKDSYLWFSLKDPAVLNSTVFWMENRGRHGHPWNGRNNCLGLEDVTAYFADGLMASAEPNMISKEGIATAVELSGDRPTVVNYIQGVARIPAGFDVVSRAEFAPGQVTFWSESGRKTVVPVKHEFLKSGSLQAAGDAR